jgi:hypothetical protein
MSESEGSRNPHAVALGALGASKGGTARMSDLSPEQRKRLAKLAANKRWNASPNAATPTADKKKRKKAAQERDG